MESVDAHIGSYALHNQCFDVLHPLWEEFAPHVPLRLADTMLHLQGHISGIEPRERDAVYGACCSKQRLRPRYKLQLELSIPFALYEAALAGQTVEEEVTPSEREAGTAEDWSDPMVAEELSRMVRKCGEQHSSD